VLQVVPPNYSRLDISRDQSELSQLVDTYGGEVISTVVQHRVNPYPDMYIGGGKVEWLKSEVKLKKIDIVIVNAIVKPSQLFRIEKVLWEVNTHIQVWDRIDLILNIFEKHAGSKEAKLQIELARIDHEGPRIYGLGKTVLSRQGGGIGQRGGSGETNIEFEKRLMKVKIKQLKKELDHVKLQKHDRIKFRQELGYGPVALVGYTSAGKTTLFNTLTGKHKEINKGLFTTLDTVVGKMKTPDLRLPVLISDTIGFIRDLPPGLINAFQSTLMESLEAKLILHIVDATDELRDDKIDIVNKILAELKITQPVILVFNKIDQLTSLEIDNIKANYLGQSVLYISAASGSGIDDLKKNITNQLIPPP
jgi:GTP-binding protein HflX